MKVEVMRSRARSGVATQLGGAITNLDQSRSPIQILPRNKL